MTIVTSSVKDSILIQTTNNPNNMYLLYYIDKHMIWWFIQLNYASSNGLMGFDLDSPSQIINITISRTYPQVGRLFNCVPLYIGNSIKYYSHYPLNTYNVCYIQYNLKMYSLLFYFFHIFYSVCYLKSMDVILIVIIPI